MSWREGPTQMPMTARIISILAADVTVVDGDTIRVRSMLGGGRIGLAGHETPGPTSLGVSGTDDRAGMSPRRRGGWS